MFVTFDQLTVRRLRLAIISDVIDVSTDSLKSCYKKSRGMHLSENYVHT